MPARTCRVRGFQGKALVLVPVARRPQGTAGPVSGLPRYGRGDKRLVGEGRAAVREAMLPVRGRRALVEASASRR